MVGRTVSFSIESFGVPAGRRTLSFLIALELLALVTGAQATVFSREQDIVDLRLGQRVRIDDGTCPAGQIKEVSGAKMTETGVLRARKCVPRAGPKKMK
jgi:hypothetical protein